MKRSSKIIAFILAVFMLCTFAACSKKNEQLNNSQTVSAESAKEEIKTEIDKIESEYTNESGYISQDKTEEVLKKVYEFLLKKSDETKLTELGTECIYVKFKDDSGYVYQPRVEGYKLNGDDINITTLQPYFTEFGKQNSPDEAALSVTKSVPKAKFNDKDNLDDAKVTVNAIKSLNNYKIIIWDGHGGYAPTLHSFMSISVPYKKIKKIYYDDCKNDIFIESSNKNSTILTVKFFEKYFNDSDFDGAVLYLGTCLSAADDILAKTFISKGASCVFGNTDVTTVAYDSCMMKSVFSYLSKGESSKKALNKSIKENESKKHGVKTDVVMYGDFNLTLKNMGNVNTSDTTASTTKDDSADWKSSLIDYIYNLPKHAELEKIIQSDFLCFELIDMNEDQIPEIILYFISAGGGGCGCTSYAYWDGTQYVTKYIDGNNSPAPENTIIPYRDNNTKKTVYISGMLDKDCFDEPLNSGPYSAGYFWRNKWSQDVWEFKNNKLTLSKSFKVNEVQNFDKLYNPSAYPVEERQEALDNVREYNQMLHETYSVIDAPYCEYSITANGIICDNLSIASYHEVMSKEKANGFVNAYLNKKHNFQD